MKVLSQLASAQGRRDEQPNQDLAVQIIQRNEQRAIPVLVDNLRNRDKKIQNDCIKVLYEIGYREPLIIADYVHDFILLLHTKNNRLTWGCMIALSTIAHLRPDAIGKKFDEIKFVIEQGSVITVDAGVKTLAKVASANPGYRQAIFPWLLQHIQTCRPKEVPMHAEFIAVAIDESNRVKFLKELKKRKISLTERQLNRVNKLIKKIEES